MLSKRKLLKNIYQADLDCKIFISKNSIDENTIELMEATNVLYDRDQDRIVVMCDDRYKGVLAHDDNI